MIPEFSEPSLDILVSEMLGNVVDQKSSHSSSVVRTGDSSVPLLASCVPDLGLDSLPVNLDNLVIRHSYANKTTKAAT